MCRGRLTSSEHVLPMSSIRSQWANSTQLYTGWKIREAIWTSKGAITTLILLVCHKILLYCWSWDRAMPHHCWSQKKTTLCLVEGPPAPPYSNIHAQGSSSCKDPRCLKKMVHKTLQGGVFECLFSGVQTLITFVIKRKCIGKTLQGGGAGGEESLPAWAEQWKAFLQGATCDISVLIAFVRSKEKHLQGFSHTLGAFQIKFDPSWSGLKRSRGLQKPQT